jgi:hypothetical protein
MIPIFDAYSISYPEKQWIRCHLGYGTPFAFAIPSMQKPKRKMDSQDRQEEFCEVCKDKDPVSRCDGCGRSLCKRCRNMEIYGSKSFEISIKYFCPTCIRDPEVNLSMGCNKVLGLEDITDMVNQDHSKANKFKIKLKIS